MFNHAYFGKTYFYPNYWNPVLTQTVSPTSAAANWLANAPTLTAGSVSASPATATAQWLGVAPTFSVGGDTLAPLSATAQWLAGAIIFTAGAVTLNPLAALARWLANDPTFTNTGGGSKWNLPLYMRKRRR